MYIIKSCIFFFVVMSFATTSWTQTSHTYKKQIKKHRKEYKKAFLNNDHSPLDKQGIKHVSFFAVNESYQVLCNVQLTPDEETFEMATYSGITKPYRKYAVATCPVNGKDISLAIYQSLSLIKIPMYRDYLFIPFKDDTNGELTYGGGRYLDISLKDIQNQEVTLDFNKAYNPYCAYSDGYNCPVPPLENHLELEILAGEKAYEK